MTRKTELRGITWGMLLWSAGPRRFSSERVGRNCVELILLGIGHVSMLSTSNTYNSRGRDGYCAGSGRVKEEVTST